MKLLSVILVLWSVTGGERVLQYPGRNDKLKIVLRSKWENYYKCLNKSEQRIWSYFVLPGQTARLNCTECRKPFDDATTYTWKQRAMDLNATSTDYENLPETFTLTGFNDLVMRNAWPEYSGIYQCFRGGAYLSTHIIEIPEQTAIVPINNSLQIYENNNNSIEWEIEWGQWSKCSKCGIVGKRFQYGICVLKANNAEPFHKKFCLSRFLDNATRNAISTAGLANFAHVELCKVDCKTNGDVDFKGKKDNILELFRTTLEREIVNVQQNEFLTLQCPGISDENISITWKVLNMEIIPEAIEERTKGRIKIDLLQRLQFQETKLHDSNIYSCWQRERLIGIIHLDVEEKTKEYGKWLSIFTALSIIFLAIHIALKAMNHKKTN